MGFDRLVLRSAFAYRLQKLTGISHVLYFLD
ncbi:hypothetical protein LMG3410_01504 [Achromobacter aegrifaciens]|uniref:Uncharacterized protein n=1 Tax=Achromobacter mucicolens TaxID=1389922 RepID=A0ABM8LL46_9BURK|nr:hypothetical protein LMG3410_01504 [Achromobacter aegrifaciens]CAB3914296.1 hypothetical protein LMG3415_05145 [Achromobacter mucicolens]